MRKKIETIILEGAEAQGIALYGAAEEAGMFVMPGPGVDARAYAVGRHYHILPGCVDHRGVVSVKARAEHIRHLAAECRDKGLRVYGVVGKFCTRNPEQEQTMADVLAPHIEDRKSVV